MNQISVREAAAFLHASDRILLLCHQNPDGDTLGSAYGLYHALIRCGKQVRILCSDEIPPKMRYLAEGYQNADWEPETVVAVDIADLQLFGEALAPYRERVDLCIDHHPSNTGYAARVCLSPESAANCELIVQVIDALGVTIDSAMATCLYTGIVTDTGCFQFANVTAKTHQMAARLMDIGCNWRMIHRVIFESKPMNLVMLEREVLNHLEFYCQNRVALITVTLEMLERYQLSEAELDGITAITRKIEGVEVGITLKQRGEELYKVSMRSMEHVNVSQICQDFGGGGHIRAAGCTLSGPIASEKQRLIAAVAKAMKDGQPEE